MNARCVVGTALLAGLAALLAAQPAQGGTAAVVIERSHETTVALATGTLADEQIERRQVGAIESDIIVLDLPARVDLDAVHRLDDGSWLVSLDSAAVIGGLSVDPATIVRIAGSSISVESDLRAAGVPAGANLDALAMDGTDLLLSFDIVVVLDGQAIGHDRLVRYDGIAFSAEPAFAADAPDLVAAHRFADGRMLLSFATAGMLGGVPFDGRDVLEHDPATGSWQVLERADAEIDALSAREPGDALFRDGFEGA